VYANVTQLPPEGLVLVQ